MGRMKKARRRGGWVVAMSAILFCVMLVVLIGSTLNLSRGANEKGAEATRRAIERAAVLCYATEGFYPPSLAYITEHYGVQVDERYTVDYQILAANITPSITVAY